MTASPTILIADPDEETRLALAEAVVRIDPGASVIEAADGSALNRALAGSRIDLLFVDVLLPQTNGADIRRWRETGNPQGLVVLVTDMLAPRWSSTARRVGAYDVILKPLGDLHIARLLAAGRILSRSLDCLVVDPGQATRTLVRKLLGQSHFSFRVLEAAGGRDAVRLAEREPVDLAIIEMSLPDYPALEVACRINDRHPAARILMTGPRIEEGIQRQLATFGASGFLAKPFQFFDIDKAVHESFGLWHPYLINALRRESLLDAGPAVGQAV
ncbi:response regulator [Methylorubrum thiocyanatum]|uniref:response regulator n=1 Tax=Methylorubrum thiocyanatum TaxID=47958 RepID=UPI0035C8439E